MKRHDKIKKKDNPHTYRCTQTHSHKVNESMLYALHTHIHTHLLWHPLALLETWYKQAVRGRRIWRSCSSGHLYPAFASFLEIFWRRQDLNYLSDIKKPKFTVGLCFCDILPVDIHTDLPRVNDRRFPIQLSVNQQSTLNIVYPSEKKFWDLSLKIT